MQRVRLSRVVLAGVLLFTVAFLASHWVDSLWEQQEDAYITYQYAYRLAAGYGFTFSPGQAPTYGTTTPLWTLLLAGFCRLGLLPHRVAPWLTSCFHGGLAVTLLLLGVRLSGLTLGMFSGALWALGFSVFFGTSGMETSLVVLLSALLFLGVVEGWKGWKPGLLLGLLLLSRPDTVLFALAVLGAWALDRERRRDTLLPSLTAGFVVYLPWAAYALITFGDLVPASLRAKMMAASLLEPLTLQSFLRAFLATDSLQPIHALGLALVAIGGGFLWRRRPPLRPFLVWIPAYYLLLKMGGASACNWYYIPPLWLTGVLAFLGIEVVARKFPPLQRPTVALGSLCCLGLLVWWNWCGIRYLLAGPYRPDFHHRLADRMLEISAPGDLIASLEVGNLAYWTQRPILDLVGLTYPEVAGIVSARNCTYVLRRWKPKYVLSVILDAEMMAKANYRERAVVSRGAGKWPYRIWERKDPRRASVAPVDACPQPR